MPRQDQAATDGDGTDVTALRDELAQAMAAAQRVARRPVQEILEAIDRAVESWLDPTFVLRRQAERELPEATGFSAAMIRHGLSLQLAPLRGTAIAALLDKELGSRHAVDGDYRGRRVRGPTLIAHVLAGNIPALAAAPVLLSLALKSAVLVKPAAGDPLFASLLRASLAAVDNDLAACVRVCAWRGGEASFEDVAFRMAEVVVASGSDAAIAAIASRVRGRFFGHGHRVSLALIGRESLATRPAASVVAQRLAYDVSLWDQQGCLSPQLCYVERGGTVSIEEFGELLGAAMQEYAVELPPRQRSVAEQAAILRFRQEAEWQGGTRLLASTGSLAWSISIEDDATFLASCLNRCVRLKGVADLADVVSLIAPHRGLIEAAGVALSLEREGQIRTLLAETGIPHVCPIGTMQMPTLAWRQSGRPRVLDWITWL